MKHDSNKEYNSYNERKHLSNKTVDNDGYYQELDNDLYDE